MSPMFMTHAVRATAASPAVPSGDWQILNPDTADYPLQIVMPRPDADREAYSVYSRWPSATPYRVPVACFGGSPPFNHEIIDNDGATGIAFGDPLSEDWLTLGCGDYGVLTWANPVVGVYDIQILVTDQTLDTDTITFRLEIISRENTTYFLWLNASTGNNGNSGSYSSPKQNHNGWYEDDEDLSTHQGKQVHVRAGTYNINVVTGMGSLGYDLQIDRVKPVVFCAYEGETVIFDGNDAGFFKFADIDGDAAVIGIEWRNPETALSGARRTHILISFAQAETRFLAFRNTFVGHAAALGEGDGNHAVIMFAEYTPAGQIGAYSTVIQNNFNDISAQDLVLMYTLQYCVFEGNRVNGYELGQGFFIKGHSHNHLSHRFNYTNDNDAVLFFMSEFTDDVKGDIEYKFNVGKLVTATIDGGVLCFGQGLLAEAGIYGPFFCARNSWSTPYISLTSLEDGPFTFRNEAIKCDAGFVADDGFDINGGWTPSGILIKDDLAVTSGTMFDADMKLTGSFRTTYLGTHGAEFVYA